MVEGRPGPATDSPTKIALPVLVMARNHKEACDEARRLLVRGFAVVAWDMMKPDGAQFTLA